MHCPVCTNVPLAIAERQGIEIDYCPTCRGVWLDRGELDKLMSRAESGYELSEVRGHREDEYDDDRDGGGIFGGFGRKRGRRRESMLGDIFDFG